MDVGLRKSAVKLIAREIRGGKNRWKGIKKGKKMKLRRVKANSGKETMRPSFSLVDRTNSTNKTRRM